MIPVCTECSKFGDPTKLYLDGTKLVCKTCGFVYPGEFKEEDGMVLSRGAVELNPKPESVMYVKIVDTKDPSKQSFACVESLPLEPYSNGRKIKGYKIKATYAIEVYYE